MARLLLQYGADPNGNGGDANPLMAAVLKGDVPLARLLVDAGANTETPEDGTGLLSYAVMQKKREMVAFLLERNIGSNDKHLSVFLQNRKEENLRELVEKKQGTDWLLLVKAGDVEGVQAALRDGADVNILKDGSDFALLFAAENGDTAMLRLLLDAGADPNQASDYGVTPLHEAATKGTAVGIALLLERGASVSAENKWGQTPLLRAALNSHHEAADLLVAYGGARLSVVEAILLHRREAADHFWSSGTPVDYANEAGMTALHAAVKIGDAELVTALLQRGANLEATNKTDRTPLMVAVDAENLELVRLLLDHGANPAGSGATSFTPLESAITHRNEPLLRLLLERGASLEPTIPPQVLERIAEKSGGKTPPHTETHLRNRAQPINQMLSLYRHSLADGDKERKWKFEQAEHLWPVLRTLIEFGADPNSGDDRSNSLLSSLVEFGSPFDLIQTVIAKGAAVNPTNSYRTSPLMLALQAGRAEVVEALLIAGANPNGGMTQESPLDIARRKESPELVALLEKYGASDEKRQSMVAALGDDAKHLLRSLDRAAPTAETVMFDFSALRGNLEIQRTDKIAEQRKQLEAEVQRSEESRA